MFLSNHYDSCQDDIYAHDCLYSSGLIINHRYNLQRLSMPRGDQRDEVILDYKLISLSQQLVYGMYTQHAQHVCRQSDTSTHGTQGIFTLQIMTYNLYQTDQWK